MDELRKEYEMKLDEYARMLDLRQARIKKLESQLRDVAYGTKQYKIQPPTDDMVCINFCTGKLFHITLKNISKYALHSNFVKKEMFHNKRNGEA